MNLTELIKSVHEAPNAENNKAFADFFRAMVEDNSQVYTAVKPQGSGYVIDTAEHAGNIYVIMFSDSGMAATKDGSRQATIGLSNLIDSCYSNPHIRGIAINPYDRRPVFIQRRDLQFISGKEDPRQAERSWGEGIPEYSQADLMTAEEAVEFAMEIVAQYGLAAEGYNVIESSNGVTAFPNFAAVKNGQLYFVSVCVALAPAMPSLKPGLKEKLLSICAQNNAKLLYAPVSFASKDPERAGAGLALVGDEFMSTFPGFVELA